MATIDPAGIDDLELAHGVLADFFSDDPEPIPDWPEGDREKLLTLCGCTEVSAFGEAQYPTLAAKAAKLFYSSIKTHPFPNGNKRFAFVAVLVLVIKNGARFNASPGEVAYVATWVANGDPHKPQTAPDKVVRQLESFFRERIEFED